MPARTNTRPDQKVACVNLEIPLPLPPSPDSDRSPYPPPPALLVLVLIHLLGALSPAACTRCLSTVKAVVATPDASLNRSCARSFVAHGQAHLTYEAIAVTPPSIHKAKPFSPPPPRLSVHSIEATMWTPPPSHSSSRMAAHAIHPQSQQLYPQQTSPPTSLSSHLHIPAPCRQLHPPKSPLYRPAVLRAIEGPLRPPTAASTPTGSPKSLNEEFGEVKNCAFDNDDSASEVGIASDICEEDDAVDVAGPPMRGHWKPDAQATACDSPTCIRNFSMMVRRHHCRRCGNVFCFQHATKWLPLSQNARFHPKGLLSKVCDGCYGDYQRLLRMKRNNSMSSASTSSTLSNASPMMAMGVKPIAGARSAEAGLAGKVGSYVGSVPRDWSWSTF